MNFVALAARSVKICRRVLAISRQLHYDFGTFVDYPPDDHPPY
jgi:hypothetical protein